MGTLLVVAAAMGLVASLVTPRAEKRPAETMRGVAFTSFTYEGRDAAPTTPAPAGAIANPILTGSYPDPSICRAGDSYYLVTSTFAYFPGIPVFKSKDLAHWEQVGHVLSRPGQLQLKGRTMTEGIYAPAIRYSRGKFYVISTSTWGVGNFVSTATDPAGPWSDPVALPEVHGIDPSLFFDEESGKAYVVHNGEAPEKKPLYDGHRAIYLLEFDPETGKTTSEPKLLVNGGTDLAKKPIWIEGPHIYRVGGKYILMCAEGGTGPQHSEVVFRADKVEGPYEPYSGNPILTQRHLPEGRADAVTTAGHADLVEGPGGKWYGVFLACRRPARGSVITGRETFMLPVEWREGWPVFVGGTEPIALPAGEGVKVVDEFNGPTLGLAWNFLRTPPEEGEAWWSLTARPGALVMVPRGVALTSKENPSFVGRRQQHQVCTATAAMDLDAGTPDGEAGIVAIQNETHYLFLGARVGPGGARKLFLERCNGKADAKPEEVTSTDLPATAKLTLRIRAEMERYTFEYASDGGEWKTLAGDVDGSLLGIGATNGFVGTYLGMYARTRE